MKFADHWLALNVVGLRLLCGPPPYFPHAGEMIADLMICDPAAIPVAAGQVLEIRAGENDTEYMVSSPFATVTTGRTAHFLTGPSVVAFPRRNVNPFTQIAIEARLNGLSVAIANEPPQFVLGAGESIRAPGPFTLNGREIPVNGYLEIRHTPAGAELRVAQRFEPISAGARRRFVVRGGSVEIRWANEIVQLEPGATISVLGQDQGFKLQAGKTWKPRQGSSIFIVPSTPGVELATGCPCGLTDCQKVHRVAGWQPAVTEPYATLNFFAKLATLGIPPAADQRGANPLNAEEFARALYFPLLCGIGAGNGTKKMGRLRHDGIEEKVCQCGESYFLDARCPRCGERFDGDAMRRVSSMRIILIIDPPLYRRAGRVHCSLKFDKFVPEGWPEASVYHMFTRELTAEYACPECGFPLVDSATKQKTVRVESCPNCGAAVQRVFHKQKYACDNYYTISLANLGRHAACADVARHVWMLDAANGSRMAAALAIQRARRRMHQGAPCGHPLYGKSWCPICREQGIPIRNREVPDRPTRTWVPIRTQWVALGLANINIESPADQLASAVDETADLDVAPDEEEQS